MNTERSAYITIIDNIVYIPTHVDIFFWPVTLLKLEKRYMQKKKHFKFRKHHIFYDLKS